MSSSLASTVRGSWQQFLEAFESLRPELYRYCRHLTSSPWDAEDLAQDVLTRAFVTLGKLGAAPPNPRAWLFRVATNAWIDQQRWPRGPIGDAVRAIDRLERDGDRLARLRNYYFTPDRLVEVCAELGVPCKMNGYKFWRECH
jgi:RNA polymerase sigma factor (sigma-70 family)